MEQEALIRDYLFDQNEGLRKVIARFLNDVMQEEVAKQIEADHYERTDKRRAYRNGIKKRNLKKAITQVPSSRKQDHPEAEDHCS